MLPTLPSRTTELGTGPCGFTPPCHGVGGGQSARARLVHPHQSSRSSLWGVTWHTLRPMSGCRDTSQPSSSLSRSFQLTVEMFDYLECELNLFQTGESCTALGGGLWELSCAHRSSFLFWILPQNYY